MNSPEVESLFNPRMINEEPLTPPKGPFVSYVDAGERMREVYLVGDPRCLDVGAADGGDAGGNALSRFGAARRRDDDFLQGIGIRRCGRAVQGGEHTDCHRGHFAAGTAQHPGSPSTSHKRSTGHCAMLPLKVPSALCQIDAIRRLTWLTSV